MPTPPKSLDDMPLAAYGGSGMQDEGQVQPEPTTTDPAVQAPVLPVAADGVPAAASSTADALPVPEDEPSHGPGPLARIVRTFRTSRIAAGAGFAVVIVVGLVLLSGGGASPTATASTPTQGPTAAPTITPPSGDASMTISGVATGTFTLGGLAGGQQVSGGAVVLGWGDAQQTTLSIAGPLDRGTRTTDEHLVLTITALVAGQPVTFTSAAGECTIGMAEVGTKVQGSFTCRRLKGPDGKATIEASGNYRS
jgi:hypothetical protein